MIDLDDIKNENGLPARSAFLELVSDQTGSLIRLFNNIYPN